MAILLISAPQIATASAPAGGKLPGTLSVGDISIVEGDTQVLVPVTFTGDAPTFEFTITAFTGPGDTATDGADFTGRTTTLTGTGLPQTKIFNVEIKDDTEVEGNETFTVKITGVAGAGAADVTIGDDTATVTITPDGDTDDGGGGGGTPTLSINNVSKLEGGAGDGTAFDFTVTLSSASDPFSVDAATANGTATTGDDDYGPINKQTLNFDGNAGETKNVSVLVLGDTKDESDETFKVQLSNVQGSGNVPANNNLPEGVGTIQNDDDGGGGGGGGNTPTLSINNVQKPEGTSASGPVFVFTVTLSAAASAFSVDAATEDGSAKSSDDDYFAIKAHTLEFAGKAVTCPPIIGPV